MRVRIEHLTAFTYGQPAAASFNEVRLTPRNDEHQNLLDFTLQTDPPARTTAYRDHFGTLVHAFNVTAPHRALSVVGSSVVVIYPRPKPPREPPGAATLDALEDPVLRDAQAEWLHRSPRASGGEHLYAFAQHVRRVVSAQTVVDLVYGVAAEVHGRFAYSPGTSYVSSTVDDLLERGTGVCQDFAHLTIATLRDLGVPARYVSGYFYAGPAEAVRLDEPLAVESHAWVEALIPGWGWLEVDPTNDCPADERHVTVAVGRDYADVAPVRGTRRGGSGAVMTVRVTMVAPSAEVARRVAPLAVLGPAGAVASSRSGHRVPAGVPRRVPVSVTAEHAAALGQVGAPEAADVLATGPAQGYDDGRAAQQQQQ